MAMIQVNARCRNDGKSNTARTDWTAGEVLTRVVGPAVRRSSKALESLRVTGGIHAVVATKAAISSRLTTAPA
jgi:hypothetical protein